MKELNWGTTPGMGDSMMGLNCAYRWSEENKSPIQLNLHWWHDKNHLHHVEEEETIIERTDYIHQFYQGAQVKVNHVINSNQTQFCYNRFDWFNPRSSKNTNNWAFRKDTILPTDKNKVVIWRPIFNAETPRKWKRIITIKEWDFILYSLSDMGYNIIELCYRTPISEVNYHINTCNFIICYDGMWHYIAKNYFKPMIIASWDSVTAYHTRHAVALADNTFTNYVSNIHTEFNFNGDMITPYDFMHRKAEKYKKEFWKWYDGNR